MHYFVTASEINPSIIQNYHTSAANVWGKASIRKMAFTNNESILKKKYRLVKKKIGIVVLRSIVISREFQPRTKVLRIYEH